MSKTETLCGGNGIPREGALRMHGTMTLRILDKRTIFKWKQAKNLPRKTCTTFIKVEEGRSLL